MHLIQRLKDLRDLNTEDSLAALKMKLNHTIKALIEFFEPQEDISLDDIRPKGKPISEWVGSFVFDRNIDQIKGVSQFNSYINTKTGENFTVGDYVESNDGMKGVITKFGVDGSFTYATISESRHTLNYILSLLKKVPGKEIWLHKPSDVKFIIDRNNYDSLYCFDALNYVTGIIVKIPSFIIYHKSQDWVKL